MIKERGGEGAKGGGRSILCPALVIAHSLRAHLRWNRLTTKRKREREREIDLNKTLSHLGRIFSMKDRKLPINMKCPSPLSRSIKRRSDGLYVGGLRGVKWINLWRGREIGSCVRFNRTETSLVPCLLSLPCLIALPGGNKRYGKRSCVCVWVFFTTLSVGTCVCVPMRKKYKERCVQRLQKRIRGLFFGGGGGGNQGQQKFCEWK